MSEIQGSTADVAEPIMVQGGDSPVTFDDLERVSSLPSMDSQAKTSKEPKAAKEESNKKGENKDVESKSKEASSSKKQSKEEVASKDAAKEGAAAAFKTYKLKNGEADVDLRSDTLVDAKVDGKVEKVPFQDLLDSYSSKSHNTREFQKLKSERDSFTSERDNLNYAVKHVHDLIVDQKNPRAAIYFLAEALGTDPNEVWNETVGKIREAMKSTSDLSDDQRRIKELEDEVAFKNEREVQAKQRADKESQAKASKALESEVMAKHNLDEQTYKNHFDLLKSTGKFQEITPQLVGEYAGNLHREEMYERILTSVKADPEKVQEYASEIKSISKAHPDLSEADLQNIAMEVFGNEKERRLARKVTKLQQSSPERAVNRNPDKDSMFFSDLN